LSPKRGRARDGDIRKAPWFYSA